MYFGGQIYITETALTSLQQHVRQVADLGGYGWIIYPIDSVSEEDAEEAPDSDVLPVVVVVRGPAEGDGERNEEEDQWEEQSPARYRPTAVECSQFA